MGIGDWGLGIGVFGVGGVGADPQPHTQKPKHKDPRKKFLLILK